jgi:predicted acyltransferase
MSTEQTRPETVGASSLATGDDPGTRKLAINATAGDRLQSLDAFRGFTMSWLLGGNAFFLAIAAWGGIEWLNYQLKHSQWEGLRYYDLVWPSFMLMVGMAIPFSFARRSQMQSRGGMIRDAWKRAIILFLLGSVRESIGKGVPQWIELSSALQPIAVAYLVTSYLAGRAVKLQVAIGAGILVVYALLLAFVPAPGIAAGTYEKGKNLVSAIDLAVLGRHHPGGWGTVLSTLPTITNTIVGLLLGQVLLSARPQGVKLKIIAATAAGCLAAGYALSPVIPIIMKVWTTTYALVTIGWACLLFLVFYWIVDVRGWRGWAFPLVVIGVNALAAYLLPTFMPIGRIVGVFTKPLAEGAGSFGPVITTGAVFLGGWLLLWWLYRRKIFLRP